MELIVLDWVGEIWQGGERAGRNDFGGAGMEIGIISEGRN